jgi:uncharacterized protein (DUF924 family)
VQDSSTTPRAAALLDWWLRDVGLDGWYLGSVEVDAAVRARAGDLLAEAAEGGLGLWLTDARGALAYIVLTDQLSRNIHRGNALAFALDRQARAAAKGAIARGWDLAFTGLERQFFYMPLEHSEDPADQDLAVALMTERMAMSPETILHARAHQAVIARFGRFPFRNAVLGRTSTAEEAAWLAVGAYPALVKSMREGPTPTI